MTVSYKALSQTEAQKALLTADDLPLGWQAAPSKNPGPRDVDPAKCSVILQALDQPTNPVAKVAAAFSSDTDLSLQLTITSWPTDQSLLLRKVVAASKRCTSFSAGASTSFIVNEIALPNLGDTIVLRLEGLNGNLGFTQYVAYVVRGQNVLRLQTNGLWWDDADVEQTLRPAVARLETAVAR